jgi:chromosome segregation ATPase
MQAFDRKLTYAHNSIFTRDTMSSMKQAKKYTAKVNEHQMSAKKLAKAAKFRARAAKLREQVAKHDAKIRSLQRKIADLERRANQIAGPPMR